MTPSTLAASLRRGDGSLALIPYLMAGHPDVATTREVGRRLAGSGVGAVELGLPHSDPLADGPTIARSARRALDAGATTAGCLELAADIAAEGGAPVVLMTYVNIVLAYGPERFARDAAEAGVAGIILPDLPVEEGEPVLGALRRAALATVPLVAPTSPRERVEAACRAATGFIYCVTVTGITGTRSTLPPDVPALLARVREAGELPVAAGFGISRPEHVSALRHHADAVVVGSALVEEIDRGGDVRPLVQELLTACR